MLFSQNNPKLRKKFRRIEGELKKKSMSNQTEPKPKLLLLDSSLRLSLLPLSVACLWVTVTTHQNNSEYGNINFSNFMALKYMAFTTAVAAGYAVLALICSWVRCFLNKAWLFFLSDQVIAYLLVTSGSAVTELAYLAYKGDIEVTWSEACSSYGSFCHSLKIALSLHFLSLFFFLALSLISAYRTFSLFHPPPPLPATNLHTHASLSIPL